MQYIGLSVATSTGASPPLDCMIVKGTPMPMRWSSQLRWVKYLATTGLTYALITVVLVRSYSRISGSSSLEIESSMSGFLDLRASAMAASCSGIRVGVKERDRHRLDPALDDAVGNALHVGHVEGDQHLAPEVDALADLVAQTALH